MRQRGATIWQVSGVSIAAFAGLWLAPMTGGLARAETPEVSPGGAIGLGNRSWSAPATSRASGNELQFSARAGLASDYIYRGTTLSDHGPAAGAALEASFGALYAGTTVATVKLPTQPVAEFTFAGGIRPKIATIDFDLGVTYFAYPGERLPGATNGINYWEAVIRGDRSIGESIRIAGGYAYSPNVSNTGASSQYVAAGLGFDVPDRLLPESLGVSFTTAAGYSWFGNQAPQLGGFPLPAYLNWQAGVTFTHKAFNLDLRYYDTNLSKENCFVFTGDPNARPGGRVDLVTNPAGLVSNWCGATFVAKAWFAF